MKIERISDNQIRCILTGEDLAQRQLRLSELAYGTDKARTLFRDLMQEASRQCGFDVENYPIMVEAIPLAGGSIVLIVTKVDNPEELDTRFSNFAPSVQNNAADSTAPAVSPLDHLIRSLHTSSDETDTESYREKLQERREFSLSYRLYSFDSMKDVIRAVKAIAGAFHGESALYRDEDTGRCYLVLKAGTPRDIGLMQGVFASLTEYGHPEPISPARRQFLIGRCTAVCPSNAVEILSSL